MSQLPVAPSSQTEAIVIAPENLEIANCYLQMQDVRAVATELDINISVVSDALAKREVKAYIDAVFLDVGFNNRFKMRSAMDAILKKKFQDLEDSDTGSAKDIADLLALSHKMAMEHLDRQIQLEKLRMQNETNIKSQVNVQINGDGSNYSALLAKLMENH